MRLVVPGIVRSADAAIVILMEWLMRLGRV